MRIFAAKVPTFEAKRQLEETNQILLETLKLVCVAKQKKLSELIEKVKRTLEIFHEKIGHSFNWEEFEEGNEAFALMMKTAKDLAFDQPDSDSLSNHLDEIGNVRSQMKEFLFGLNYKLQEINLLRDSS